MSMETSHGTGVPPFAGESEVVELHTRILRCMLAADDSYAYWQNVDPEVPASDRARAAFEQRWFGTKSEARVRTLMADMLARYDAFPESLALLHDAGRIPSALRAPICHLHTQLADPIYRSFTGVFLPERREQGRTTLDRATVARWIDSLAPGRWSAMTCVKFASNLLATAHDVGLVRGRTGTRQLPSPVVPGTVLGYALYLLRGVRIVGSLTHNPYLRSFGVTPGSLRTVAAGIPGLSISQLGDAAEVTFLHPRMCDWGLRYLRDRTA